MKSIKIILFGMAFMLLGIACAEATVFMTYGNAFYALYEAIGVLCPMIGIVIFIVGMFIKTKKD